MDSGRVWAEIDLDALNSNLAQVRRFCAGRRLLVAVKADAYGHGLQEVARELEGKVDEFGVAGVEEGISLRKTGIKTPILVLSPAPYPEIPELVEHRLTPSVTEPEFARRLSEEAVRRGATVAVHVEVDTGMGRTGVSVNEAYRFIPMVASLPGLRLEGVFTHFPSADTDVHFTENQVGEYARLLAELEQEGLGSIIRHSANSAGLLNVAESHLDMVRPGLVVYGILPDSYSSGRRSAELSLRPVMSLRARVVNLRELPAGASVSYERRFFTHRRSRVAVITAGYGDGYPYALTNRGRAILAGERVPVVGNVCMDLTMFDATDVPRCAIGDTLTLLGTAGQETITANELAAWAGTIPYEIICGVSPRVPRVYIRQGKTVKVRNLLNDHQ